MFFVLDGIYTLPCISLPKNTIQTQTARHSTPGRRIPRWKIKPLSLDSVSPVLLTTWFISLYEANPCLPQDNVILRPLLSSTSQSCLPADAHLLKSFQTQGCYSLGPHYNLISIPLKFQHNSRLLRHETDQHGTHRECLRRLGLQTSP